MKEILKRLETKQTHQKQLSSGRPFSPARKKDYAKPLTLPDRLMSGNHARSGLRAHSESFFDPSFKVAIDDVSLLPRY
jgi:hypothetical protein